MEVVRKERIVSQVFGLTLPALVVVGVTDEVPYAPARLELLNELIRKFVAAERPLFYLLPGASMSHGGLLYDPWGLTLKSWWQTQSNPHVDAIISRRYGSALLYDIVAAGHAGKQLDDVLLVRGGISRRCILIEEACSTPYSGRRQRPEIRTVSQLG